MKYVRTGKYNPKALELVEEIDPTDRAKKVLFKRLNYLLNFISERKPDSLAKYVENLKTQFNSLNTIDYLKDKDLDLTTMISNMDVLKKYPDLAETVFNYFIYVLQILDNEDWLNEKVKVLQKNYLRSFLTPMYYNLYILIETIGRDEAITLYKKYITHYIIDRDKADKREFLNLTTHYENMAKQSSKPSAWVIVHGLFDEGKYFYCNANCLWLDALEDLSDREIKYCVCCYGDYQGAKFYYDDNIILTMEHTIAQGDPYCSRVLHDTRVDWDLRHPPKYFWDSIMSEDEK